MRSLSYLKQITINNKGRSFWWEPDPGFIKWLMVHGEQTFIVMCNLIIEMSSIKISQSVNLIRKTLFSNKRFYWKRKRRIGL